MDQGRAVTHVLVVDDSAVVRQTLGALLTELGGFDVVAAADPIIAMHRMAEQRPDVIVLDLEMPRMDGLTFLRKLMVEDPIPVVVCSTFSHAAGAAAITALAAGAVDIVTKPELGVRDFLEESAVAIVVAVQAAAVAQLPSSRPKTKVHLTPPAKPKPTTHWPLVAIGASTGGTEAIAEILQAMPEHSPGFVIVQHMPAGFTRTFAERLDSKCRIEVREAKGGEPVRPGLAILAPGDRHLRVRGRRERFSVEVEGGPPISRHRPSVDALFRSVARSAGADAIGVVLTGMGEDGAEGLQALKEAGARTLAQDETSSVVFGMPKAAIERGAAQEVLPLAGVATAILSSSGS